MAAIFYGTETDAAKAASVTQVVAAEPEKKAPEQTADEAKESSAPEGEQPKGKTAGEPEAPKQDGEATDKPKGDGGFQRRIDKLTKEKRQAERRAAELERKLQEQTGTAPAATAEPPSDDEPKEADFPSQAEYVKALGKWSARQELQQQESVRIAEETQRRIDEQLDKAREKYSDFDQVGLSEDVMLPGNVHKAIAESENMAELLYYFGSNPEEAERIMGMKTAHAQLMALGKIEAKLEASLAAGTKPADAAPKQNGKVASSAPEPIRPLKESASGTVPAFDPYTARVDDPRWKTWREEQDKKEAAQR